MNESCPIVFEKVNEKITKINALFVFLGLLGFVLTPFKWIIIPIFIDFLIRVVFGIKYSPVCFIIKHSLNILNTKPHLVNAGPKKFAAKIGLSLTSIMLISFVFNLNTLGISLGIISLVAIGMEVFFNYCVACKIYSILTSMGIKL